MAGRFNGGLIMTKTELYFGLDDNNGGLISFEEFIPTIAVRFPEGFTVLDANGQYVMNNGRTIKESSKVVILLHKGNQKPIDAIKDIYKRRYNQESVLQVDYLVEATF